MNGYLVSVSKEFRLLTIHAHPDDESSKGAGTVALYADSAIVFMDGINSDSLGYQYNDFVRSSFSYDQVSNCCNEKKERHCQRTYVIDY